MPPFSRMYLQRCLKLFFPLKYFKCPSKEASAGLGKPDSAMCTLTLAITFGRSHSKTTTTRERKKSISISCRSAWTPTADLAVKGLLRQQAGLCCGRVTKSEASPPTELSSSRTSCEKCSKTFRQSMAAKPIVIFSPLLKLVMQLPAAAHRPRLLHSCCAGSAQSWNCLNSRIHNALLLLWLNKLHAACQCRYSLMHRPNLDSQCRTCISSTGLLSQFELTSNKSFL